MLAQLVCCSISKQFAECRELSGNLEGSLKDRDEDTRQNETITGTMGRGTTKRAVYGLLLQAYFPFERSLRERYSRESRSNRLLRNERMVSLSTHVSRDCSLD